MTSCDETLDRLDASTFRRQFKLGAHEWGVLDRVGSERMAAHAREMLAQRVGASAQPNDGRQTPMRGHPVFVAQHATATCCRRCMAKWHRIAVYLTLRPDEVTQLADLVMAWIARQEVESEHCTVAETTSPQLRLL